MPNISELHPRELFHQCPFVTKLLFDSRAPGNWLGNWNPGFLTEERQCGHFAFYLKLRIDWKSNAKDIIGGPGGVGHLVDLVMCTIGQKLDREVVFLLG